MTNDYSIFISYRRDDTAGDAGRIYDRLEGRFGRERIFKDVDSMPLGVDFKHHVQSVISNCPVFLALIGTSWLDIRAPDGTRRLDDAADLVRMEIEAALSTPGVRVIPILIGGAEMPSVGSLPPSLSRLAVLNAAKVRRDPDFRHDMDRLERALASDTPEQAKNAATEDHSRYERVNSRTLQPADLTECKVRVADETGHPVSDCTIVAQADNGTTKDGRTNGDGTCELWINTRRAHRLLVAHPSYLAAIVDEIEAEKGVAVVLQQIDSVGSVVVFGTGYIPGLEGRLNLILDRSARTYLYADNIAIDGGKAQPVKFEIAVPFGLEDANGVTFTATVKHIAGRTSLLEYSRAD